VLAGLSVKAAAEKLRLPFALETIYRLGRGWHRRLAGLRTRLCREQSPADSTHPDKPSSISKPSLQTAPVRRLIFSFIFRCPSWVEVLV
jgi:hypothetical protein